MRGRHVAIPLFVGMALALAPSFAKAEPMAAACAGCHGTGGHSKGLIPSFGGKDAAMITKLLLDYKTGAREATIMDRIVKGYSDDDLAKIAAFYAASK